MADGLKTAEHLKHFADNEAHRGCCGTWAGFDADCMECREFSYDVIAHYAQDMGEWALLKMREQALPLAELRHR